MDEVPAECDAEGSCAFSAGFGFWDTGPKILDFCDLLAAFALNSDVEVDYFEDFDAVEFDEWE